MSESVLVIPVASLPKFDPPLTADESATQILLKAIAEQSLYMGRELAETSTDYVQPIAYCLFRRGVEFLSYRRAKASGEARLTGKLSAGIGGHVNPKDGLPGLDAFCMSIQREVEEELGINDDRTGEIGYVGIIFEPTSAVGKVHIGIVFVVEVLDNEDISPNDPALADLNFRDRETILNSENVERWTTIALENLED
jgi:predicted NUDIX family phosphoesterase